MEKDKLGSEFFKKSLFSAKFWVEVLQRLNSRISIITFQIQTLEDSLKKITDEFVGKLNISNFSKVNLKTNFIRQSNLILYFM